VTNPPNESTPPGRLRALFQSFKRPSTPPSTPPAAGPPATPSGELPSRIGHYVVTGKLGEGGMGVVYSARDERLEREVAIKMMSSLAGDDLARKRFLREAKAAASVNHPNICQLYDIGEHGGQLFLAMELLEGQSLADRLRQGALGVTEMAPIGLGILAALAALHARGIIHRDLKPSNVFLTSHGVKLLDFGLARTGSSEPDHTLDSIRDLTRPGIVMGTPRYMAPEQIAGGTIDARTDLFAAGVLFFEMLAGRPAFAGRNVVEILHATLNEQPPALTGSPAVAAVDRLIRRALAKRPADRPASADAMAAELRRVPGSPEGESAAFARTLTRLVVLPFRVLRSDPETDFLAFSLPDAISTSLSASGSLIVRSTATAARFGTEAPDLKAIAAEADVDRVVMGSLLRSGDQLQATAQLVEAPGGTLLTSHTVLSSLGDLFRLQDDIARRVVGALSLPLGGPATPTPDRPHSPEAYGLYLRANEFARSYASLKHARDLYQQSLDLDPGFAPAWAQLGRCHRVIAKFLDDSDDGDRRAEPALRRALDINPRLSLAHKYYAILEADTGHADLGLARLVREANAHGNDPELFAGLVHACRYCGLYSQSIAAHHEARRLDPNVPTSVEQTVLMTGDLTQLLGLAPRPHSDGGDDVIRVIGLGLAGRRDEARRSLQDLRNATQVPAFHSWADFLLSWLEQQPADMLVNRMTLGSLTIMDAPEAIFQEAWLFADVGKHDRALAFMHRAVERGYFVAPTLASAPAFDGMRDDPAFQMVLAKAEAGRARALAAFREGGGERLLGV